MSQHGQHERQGFARACLGDADAVAPGHHHRQRLCLRTREQTPLMTITQTDFIESEAHPITTSEEITVRRHTHISCLRP